MLWRRRVHTTVQSRASSITLLTVGKSAIALEAYPWRSNRATLVLAIRVGCHYCEDSLPFYRRLITLEQSHETQAHILAVFPDDQSSIQNAYGSDLAGIQVVPSVNFRKFGVVGTPTLALVDAAGLVRQVWAGELSFEGQAAVLEAVRNGPGADCSETPYGPCGP